MKIANQTFHGSYLANQLFKRVTEVGGPTQQHHIREITERQVSYHFASHFHPYVAQLVNRLIEGSVPGLQAADTDYQRNPDGTWVTFPADDPDERRRGQPIPELYEDFFQQLYTPNPNNITDLVTPPWPVKELAFGASDAYAVYNWELFYHVPLMVAMHLSKNGCYAEAQQWFHYIFDPTDDSDDPAPARFWKVKPFQSSDVKLIEEIMLNLATGEDEPLRQETLNSIMAWKEKPFRPHVVARYRQSAYMFKTVFAYLDNLIAWGDADFRKDQPEDVDDALLKYVLAANILGPRPQEVPAKGRVRPQTYANLRQELDAFGNSRVKIESAFLFNNAPPPTAKALEDRAATLRSLGNALYFCVPRNEKLLGYWDTVADRLFKIRNSLNLQGVFRQLPLFAPPIDPALLAKAVAAGVDVSAAVAGLYVPLPLARFQFLLQKAVEACQEVKTLGNSLLAALEKEDNEAIAILRARHEKTILTLAESVRYAQWQEATKAREGLEVSLQNAAQRYIYYERQLGKQESEIKLPELSELDAEGLLKLAFTAKEPGLNPRALVVDIAQDLGDAGGKIISSHEAQELDQLDTARTIQQTVRDLRLAAKALTIIPDFGIKFHFWGLGGDTVLGGTKFANASHFAGEVALAMADDHQYQAGVAARISGYARREQEWAYQSNTIAGEITQIYKQLRAAQIREAISKREWENHQRQIKQATEVEQFLTDEKIGKKANQAFYTWLKREVKQLYDQHYQFAFELAKKAERALQQELGDPQLSYLQGNYTSGKEGLLAGEKLHLSLKRMELAYHELNQREYELTKHVSLLQLDPLALLQLRITGRCTIKVPEALFDLDGAGHYFRRLKTVALTIPCVTGPYASINCRLTLTKSTIRRKATLSEGEYGATGDSDDRFETLFGATQSIVASSAQNDSGLFEVSLRDERKLPFEYAGAISEWELALPARADELRAFDYATIADVVLHLRYTAREGGELLRKGALAALNTMIADGTGVGTVRLFSVRHEFPTEWAKFQAQTPTPQQLAALSLSLRPEHYPFWSKGRLNRVTRMELLAQSAVNQLIITELPDGGGRQEILQPTGLPGIVGGPLTQLALATPTTPEAQPLRLYFDNNAMADLWLAVGWGS